MFIISVIPLTKIPRPAPQTFDYFASDKISVGGIVQIRIAHRSLLAVVVSCAPVEQKKQSIKKSSFQIKPVEKIINANAAIPEHHIELVLWTGSYFYSSLGLTMKALLPKAFARPTKKFLAELSELPSVPRADQGESGKPVVYWSHSSAEKITYYTSKIRSTLRDGKYILFLVPELYKISYFKKEIPLLSNENCFLGTRSALSTPRQNLGLIIIEEEESPFYKSFDQQPYINAKTVALKLGELTGAKVILGSNLPSVESLWAAKKGKYILKTSSSKSKMPNVKIVDMRQELRHGNYSILSRELQTRLTNAIYNNKQAILFINRKGLSTGLLCRDCGHLVKCPNCDVPMVYHETRNTKHETTRALICHHCGQKQRPPTLCPECESYRIKFIGTGTQRVEQELNKLLNQDVTRTTSHRIGRIDLDVAPTLGDQQKILQDFSEKKYSVLIGTQVMLKPELLGQVDFAGIITIDPMLSFPDFRINEQVMRLVNKLQISTCNQLLLQTYSVDNYVIRNISNISLMSEIENRKELSLPPFSQLIKLVYAHKDPVKAEQEAKILKNKLLVQWDSLLPNMRYTIYDIQILGPAPAFIPKTNNRYVWQIMLKSKIKDLTLRNRLLRVVPSDWKIDVDPIETL